MSEKAITIPSGNLALEALHEAGRGLDTAILCHPHPLYGGSMENNVVSALQKVLSVHGWGTVRFNFRGVGFSEGTYGNDEGEVDDLRAVAAYLAAQGATTLHLAGYSYGAWIALKAASTGLAPASLLLISPPLDFMDFSRLEIPPRPCLITLGDRDDYCAQSSLEQWLATQISPSVRPEVAILPSCDHFYWGKEDVLRATVLDFLERSLPAHRPEKNGVPDR